MLITCWSCKGGAGTTVAAAALALLLGAEAGPTLLVDLGGDLPATLGLAEPAAGLTTWAGGEGRPAEGETAEQVGGLRGVPEREAGGRSGPSERAVVEARGSWGGRGGLAGLEIEAGPGVRLLPRGPGVLGDGLGPALVRALGGRDRVVVDAGRLDACGAAADLAVAASTSLLVLRPCFLALRRAVAAPVRASGVVVVDEPQRVLGPNDIEAALGLPIVAFVPWDPAVARRVDAGVLGSSLPRGMARALRRVTGAPEAATPARTGFRVVPGGLPNDLAGGERLPLGGPDGRARLAVVASSVGGPDPSGAASAAGGGGTPPLPRAERAAGAYGAGSDRAGGGRPADTRPTTNGGRPHGAPPEGAA